jgi:nucleoside-triphosphatase
MRMAGFYTEEVRSQGGRTGFRVVALDGRTARLATAGGEGGARIGRYTVHVGELEALVRAQLDPLPDAELIVIDEIGKMECLSPAFVAMARRALSAPVPLLATIALAGGGFIAEARSIPGASVASVTRENRDGLPAELAGRFRRCGPLSARRP